MSTSNNKPSSTINRIVGALFFVPILIAFLVSQTAAQWLLMPVAAIMVLEFATIAGLALPLRFALVADFALFSLPDPVYRAMETTAGMALWPFIMALAGLVILFVAIASKQRVTAIFIALLIACILSARGVLGLENGHYILVALAVTVAACDIIAYFTGRHFGGAPLAPAISPKKTQSGAVGGLVGAILVAIILSTSMPFSVGAAILGATWIAVLAQAGDLLESALKRRAGVKDSGSIIPGHGGFLDRFDGYLLTMPAVYLYCLAG